MEGGIIMEYTYQWNPEWEGQQNTPQLKVTKSSLNTFEFCIKQYEFSYIERRKSEPNMAMIKGTIVHNSYEDFYNQFEIKKAEELDENNVYEYCMGLFPIDDYGDIYQTMAAFETERFMQAKNDNGLDTFLPVGNEIQCNAKLLIPQDAGMKGRGKKFMLQRDYTVHLQGIIDRVFQEGDSIIPVELKTGAWKDKKQSHMRNEMAFYKVLMDSDPDCELGEVTHWAWYFPDSNYFQLEEVKKANVNNIVKRIAKIIHAYEQGIFPASYHYAKCQYCSYTALCDSAQQNELWEW
jgi:CRISPR/Cas system-associated exonuclease Cas4 (RecB family)